MDPRPLLFVQRAWELAYVLRTQTDVLHLQTARPRLSRTHGGLPGSRGSEQQTKCTVRTYTLWSTEYSYIVHTLQRERVSERQAPEHNNSSERYRDRTPEIIPS